MVPSNLPVGTKVRVNPTYGHSTLDNSFIPYGVIVEHSPMNGGYLVRHCGPNGGPFGWSYNELILLDQENPFATQFGGRTRWERLLDKDSWFDPCADT